MLLSHDASFIMQVTLGRLVQLSRVADTVCVPTPKAHSREARIGAEAAGVPLCEEVVCKEPTANQHVHMVLTHLQ